MINQSGQKNQRLILYVQSETRKTKTIYYFCIIAFFLSADLLSGHSAFSQTTGPPLANNIQDENRISSEPFAEERAASQNFIENINEARKELAMQQVDLAQQKILMARNLLPLITRATSAQRRLTRVEFGGGLYADDLTERKSYSPIETTSLENLTRSAGPRWVKNTRSESDAKIVYVTLDLTDNKAQTYFDRMDKDFTARDLKNVEEQLEQLSDRVIKIDDKVPSVIQARDYMSLADNYVRVSNFFGARNALEKANEFLNKMKDDNIYKTHRADIIALYTNIEDLQAAFAKLDADQIKTAGTNLKKWQAQLASWAGA